MDRLASRSGFLSGPPRGFQGLRPKTLEMRFRDRSATAISPCRACRQTLIAPSARSPPRHDIADKSKCPESVSLKRNTTGRVLRERRLARSAIRRRGAKLCAHLASLLRVVGTMESGVREQAFAYLNVMMHIPPAAVRDGRSRRTHRPRTRSIARRDLADASWDSNPQPRWPAVAARPPGLAHRVRAAQGRHELSSAAARKARRSRLPAVTVPRR